MLAPTILNYLLIIQQHELIICPTSPTQIRILRSSSDTRILSVFIMKTEPSDQRSFSCQDPAAWN